VKKYLTAKLLVSFDGLLSSSIIGNISA